MQSQGQVWMNGTFVPWENATVPLLSHGFSRGSAVFEVFGTHKGPDGVFAFRMDEHLKRLEQSLELLEMERFIPFNMWGWDDTRIENMEVSQVQALLDQRRAGLVRLEETVDNERREVLKLELILDRCKVLHGE